MAAGVKNSLQQRGHKLYERGYNGTSQMIQADGLGGFNAAAEPRIIKRNQLGL
jgi:hypothetical protein